MGKLILLVTIEKQIEIPKSDDGEFSWINPSETENLPMPQDLKKYIKILADNPNAMILGYFDHDQTGKTIEEK